MPIQPLQRQQRNHLRLDDEVHFIRSWLEKPLTVGAVTPSGRFLARTMAYHAHTLAAAIVSGLPLFTKPLKTRLKLFRECLTLMRAEAPFVQFTYAVVPPIPKSTAGVKVEASERIWMNLPPARVWVYRKSESAHRPRYSS